jgi:hypothetical protein
MVFFGKFNREGFSGFDMVCTAVLVEEQVIVSIIQLNIQIFSDEFAEVWHDNSPYSVRAVNASLDNFVPFQILSAVHKIITENCPIFLSELFCTFRLFLNILSLDFIIV